LGFGEEKMRDHVVEPRHPCADAGLHIITEHKHAADKTA
jgi:hypothetical protein